MKRSAKCRRQRSLNADIAKRIDTRVARPVAAQSAILSDAVRAWPAKRATHECDDQIGFKRASCARTSSPAGPTTSLGSVIP
jgi:hypothetical protein